MASDKQSLYLEKIKLNCDEGLSAGIENWCDFMNAGA